MQILLGQHGFRPSPASRERREWIRLSPEAAETEVQEGVI